MYFVATKDSDEKPLNGSSSYVMHVPANQLPQSMVNAYWSVILVGVPDYRVVPNELKRYNFNNHSRLQNESDGSLKLAIGPKAVAGVPQSNQLPSPPDKAFSLTFRTYVPKPEMFASKWAPPPVAKTSAAAQKESSAAQNLVPDPQALTTPGGVHDPSVIAVFGQYDRMYNENGPSAGAGNQFARWVSAGGFA